MRQGFATIGGAGSRRLNADQVLEQYWQGGVPVDPAAIARAMGVRVIYDDTIDYSGHYREDMRGACIYINSSEAPVRQRFTAAHELGHYALNHGERARDFPSAFSASVSDPIEAEANRFAAQLLMPKTDVDFYIRRRGLRKISELAKAFDVSQKAMEFRLKNLGWLNG